MEELNLSYMNFACRGEAAAIENWEKTKKAPLAAGASIELDAKVVLIGINARAKNSGGFESNDPSGVKCEFASCLWVSTTTGLFIFDIELAKSAEQQIFAYN